MPLPMKSNPQAGRAVAMLPFLLLAAVSATTSCVSVKTEHKIEPIHITMDVNVRLEQELDKAFEDLDRQAALLMKSSNK